MSCTNCHQFYGSPESNNLCSSCYRKLNPEASQLLNQIRQQKEEYQNHWKELVSQGNIPLLIEYYHGPTPFPVDMMESFVRDYFSSQVRAYNIEICQQLMGHPPFHDIIHRLCPNILSDIINNLRHRYGTPPNSSHLALFDYFLTFNEFKVRLTEKDLETALCIYQGTEIIRRLLDLSKEGVFQLTKASLEAAQYLNKRPNNVPTPEKKNHILMVKAALDEQNHKRKRLLSQNNENENDDKEHDSKVEENEISRSSDGPGTTPGTTTSTTGNSYLHDMIQYGCNDLEIPFNNEAIGMKIYPTSDGNKNERRRQYYTIIEFKKQSGGNSRIIAQKLRNSSEIIELDEDTVMCDWVGDISSKQQTLWSSYQDKIIQEGVWTSRLDGDLRIEFNNLVDEFATIEPIDYHPGTKDIVRDLIHPSLYPLILSTANKPPTKGRAKYDETQRNFFHRPYEISRFQWLPSEVDIDQHGIARFVTPINNLDETKYPQLYDCLGRILTHLIPGFEQIWSYAQTLSFSNQYDISFGTTPTSTPTPSPSISFSNQRLQVIVKLTEYEFHSKNFFDGVWHYEGMSHENIVMTGLYYPLTDEHLQGHGIEFKRQFTDQEAQYIASSVPQIRTKWLEEQIQNGFIPLGHITTETSKLIVFPNCHAHRVMKIENLTNKILKRRLLAFFIIDPNKRIESTLEHPPLPRQISLKQALKDRLDLMKERKYYKESLNPRQIELCEH